MTPQPPTIHAPRAHGGPVLDLQDFVRSADGRSRTDYQAMSLALQSARERGASVLRLPRRVYTFDDPDIVASEATPHILLENQRDLIIDAQGSELRFGHIRNAFQFVNCQRVVLRNCTIDWTFNLASPGVVERQADGRNAVRIAADYPIGSKQLANAVSEYDHAAWRWVMNGKEIYYPRDCELLGPQVIYSPSFDETFKPPRGNGRLEHGTELVVRHYVYQATCVEFGGRGNEDLSFEDITLYQCPGHAFCGYGCERGFRLTRVRIERRSGSPNLISATADGAHFGACVGDILIEDCDFSHMGDDSINIHGTWLEVVAHASPRELHVTSRWFGGGIRLDPGDSLELCRKANLAPFEEGVIRRVEMDFERKLAIVTFERPVHGVVPGDFVSNVSRSSARFHIRNNYFHDHRARGMLLQARDGVVEDNHIARVMGAALQMTTDCNYWKEGYGCQNVVVRRNRIESCNYATWERGPTGRHMAAISLVCDTPSGLGDHPVHRNITFEENTINDTPGLAILIASARGVVLRSNVIEAANTQPFDATGSDHDAAARGAIMITRASDVQVEDNQLIAAADSHDRGIYVDERNTGEVTLSQNQCIDSGAPTALESGVA